MRRIAVVALSVTAACSLLTSYDGFDAPRVGVVPVEAGADAEAPSCFQRRWPAPPSEGDDRDVGELVSVFKSLRPINKEWPPFGFDLDGLCTCPERTACLGARANEPCDPTDSGIDNAAAELFDLFSKVSGTKLDESGLRAGIDSGRFSVGLRVSRWNGEADDPSVALEFLNVFDANAGTDAGARFDGNDTWIIDEQSLRAPIRRAYVSGGVLVAEMPAGALKARVFNSDKLVTARIAVSNLIVTGKIAREGEGFSLTDGHFGGRLPSRGLLELMASVGGCPGSLAYNTLKPILCDSRDLPLDPAKDGLDFACEAISFGMAFESGPARLAPDAGTPPEQPLCRDAGPVDDCK